MDFLPFEIVYLKSAKSPVHAEPKQRELDWRKRLIESHSVVAVISFPNDLFYPQASVEPVIIVIRKGVPHQSETKTLFVRITDDGFMKLKKRRLPHGNQSQLELLKSHIKSFIDSGISEEIDGVIQIKNIDMQDNHLEIIPQQYLDNAALDINSLKSSLSRLQSELLFQEIRRGLMQ